MSVINIVTGNFPIVKIVGGVLVWNKLRRECVAMTAAFAVSGLSGILYVIR